MSERKMGHVQSFGTYLGILLILFVLTGITYMVSKYDMGSWNDILALGIAGIKAGLVTLFFMHGRFEGKITWAFIWFPVLLLMLLFGGLFIDYANRDPKLRHIQTPVTLKGSEHGAAEHGAAEHGTEKHEGDGDAEKHDAEKQDADGAEHGAEKQDADGAEHGAEEPKKEGAGDH